MSDIEQKALALVREVLAERNLSDKRAVRREVSPYTEALCRAIEQCEATKQEFDNFRQKVSDAAQEYEEAGYCMGWEGFERFIIPKPKPDPLVEAMVGVGLMPLAADLRAALDALGFEIREKGR